MDADTACGKEDTMDHCGTRPLETERLLLRRFTTDDATAMYANWASDAEVTRYLTWPTHTCVADSRAVLKTWVASYARDDYYQWAIVPKTLGEPVGSIGAVDLDDRISMVHIGYCLGRRWWHQSIMSEALSALIGFFFETVGANRIESRHDANNPRSGQVMKRCGMSFEGTLRSSDWNNQGVCDACWYAILRSDWHGEGFPRDRMGA